MYRDTLVRAGALLVLALHLALSHTHNYLLAANDDRLWLYSTAAQIGRADTAGALDREVRTALVRSGASENKLFRYDARAAYDGNYAGATLLYRVAADTVAPPSSAADYPTYLARAMFWGAALTYATAAVLLLLVVATLPLRWVVAATSAVALIAVMEVAFDLAGDTWWGLPVLLPDAQTSETLGQTLWPNLAGLLLNPQVQMSPFGDTPRNHFVLLALPVFLLRWQGKYTASYAWVLLLTAVHQSQTGLLTAYLVAADAALRPAIFRGVSGALVAVTLGVFLGRETLGAAIGVARPMVVAAAAAAVVAIAAALWVGLRGERSSRLAAWLADIRARLTRRGPVAADLIVIGTLWVITFPVAYVINSQGTELQSLYFWTQVHGRSLGILRPPLILGMLVLLLDRFGAGWERKAPILAGVSALALLPSAYAAAGHERTPVDRLERQLREIEAQLGPTTDWGNIGAADEHVIYYAVSRALDGHGANGRAAHGAEPDGAR